jgi:L-asparaginase/Glu-tRNA(Gln) amidotransferase subunit D
MGRFGTKWLNRPKAFAPTNLPDAIAIAERSVRWHPIFVVAKMDVYRAN